ncbi:SDR family oxidoreductase [Acetobacter senegalensis]|uniref:SDR family oxidoreductase n=1 Tax=Acetobacter senegalensis TaxID=446692 RepID=UPI00128C492A|nr:SDR family oxidoreductase [Acetobacter senegalensis]MCG4257430.1 SDR family NAD(P)-dependent oxidoreductase [Acetobacter senegalensis]MCG4267368.1 SDR family NAD(P)-dependent oxidoreductase [Acetobacter senegalensis]MPQ74299.1 SDR family NAD(P)-dependent oxidoreductase [Acetobacter senegalensis]
MPSQIAVVTGAGAGIGRAAARALGRAGFDVALLGRNEDRLKDTARDLAAHSIRTLVIPVDVADADAVAKAADRVENELGPITAWANCAGATVVGQVATLSPQDIRRATEVTYLGSVNGTLAALERMRRRGHGAIINLDLAPALRGLPLQAVENGSRAALRGFCESLRPELLHDADRIRIVMVDLPSINTPHYGWTRNTTGKRLKPVGPVYEPEVAAEAICRAAFTTSRSISIGPSTTFAAIWSLLGPGCREKRMADYGYKAQLEKTCADTDAKDDLFESVPGAFSAHGAFDAKSRRLDSPLSFFVTSSARAGIAGALLAAGLTGLISHIRSGRK